MYDDVAMTEEDFVNGSPAQLLSFGSSTTDFLNDYPEIEPGSIQGELLKAIIDQVKADGIRKEAILPRESLASIIDNASGNIYYDVAEFFQWYFEPEAERYQIMATQKSATLHNPLRATVKKVVEHNLIIMRGDGFIPEEMDSDNLVEEITDNLTRYILNWQDWYYDRKELEDMEDYLVDRSIYEDIYGSDYGDYTNITNYLDDEEEEEDELEE